MDILPNDLWNVCWNYLTQSEYRCNAILLNRQCYKLSHSIHQSCLPRDHVILLLRKQTIEQAQDILLRLQQPIKHLEVDEACILYSNQHSRQLQLHTILSQIQYLTFLPGVDNPIHTASLICSFNQMHALQSLSFSCSLLQLLDIDQGAQYWWEFNDELYESNVQQLADSLQHIHSLSISGYYQNGYTTLLYRIIQSPPHLHVLRLDSICFDEEIVQLTDGSTEIQEIHLTFCHRTSSSSVKLNLNQYQHLRILNIYHCGSDCFTPQSILPEIQSLRHLQSLNLREWYAQDIHQLIACTFINTLTELYVFDFAHVRGNGHNDASNQYIQSHHLQLLLSACTNLTHLMIEFRHSIDPENHFFQSFVTQSIWSNNNTLQSVCFILKDGGMEMMCMARFILFFCQSATALKQFKLSPQPAWWTMELQDCFDTSVSTDPNEQESIGGYFKPFYRPQFIRLLHTVD